MLDILHIVVHFGIHCLFLHVSQFPVVRTTDQPLTMPYAWYHDMSVFLDRTDQNWSDVRSCVAAFIDVPRYHA